MSSFFQRPSGTLAMLIAAVAGPYAAFETDVGTYARRIAGTFVGDVVSDESGTGTGGYDIGPPPIHGYPTDAPSLGYAANGYAMIPPQGGTQLPSTSYYPNQPPPTPEQSPMLESHRGPAQRVQGGTHQLWDYTLGVPSLDQLQRQPQPLGGGEVHDLREVLRFDIYPGWLPQRFSRVTTVLSNVQMDGLRVPLITGTQPSDLAGTLTYYFDASQRLQRINLHGLTGDPSALANLMVQFYGLKPEQSLGGQLFTSRWNNRVSSVLHVAPAPIMYAGADHSKYIVFLELNQNSTSFALSEEAGSFLQTSQAIQRW